MIFQGGSEVTKKLAAEKWLSMKSFDEFNEFRKTGAKYAFLWDEPSMNAIYGKTCELTGIDINIAKSKWTIYMKKDYEYTGLFKYK